VIMELRLVIFTHQFQVCFRLIDNDKKNHLSIHWLCSIWNWHEVLSDLNHNNPIVPYFLFENQHIYWKFPSTFDRIADHQRNE
jgi:hypothetical protein